MFWRHARVFPNGNFHSNQRETVDAGILCPRAAGRAGRAPSSEGVGAFG